ncbi:MAG: hypothetical protein JWN95_1077 [Frankiales bacterium]|nr:hypothetical protein [Frankiales bacterium]
MALGRPSVSACLIVRDEQDSLRACLASVAPFVDEIVVCDTGSTDETMDIARQAGARLLSTPWADSFAAARNTALAACTTDWVLSLDADETVLGTPNWLAPMLAAGGDDVDALSVQITTAGGPDSRGLSAHSEVKLFRRTGVAWIGRVHERPVRIDGAPLRTTVLPIQTLTLVHHGYRDSVQVAAKASRNARLCALEFDELVATGAAPSEIARAALDLGRSRLGSGDPGAAIDALERARHVEPGRAPELTWLWATDFLIRIALSEARTDDAEALIGQLRAAGAPTEYCRWLQAQMLLLRGDLGAALPLLNGIVALIDLSGNDLDMQQVYQARALVLAELEQGPGRNGVAVA